MNPAQWRWGGEAVQTRMDDMTPRMTLGSLARASGVSEKTLRKLLRGEGMPGDAVQTAIEAALHVPTGWIAVQAVRGSVAGVVASLSDVEIAEENLRRVRAAAERNRHTRAGDHPRRAGETSRSPRRER